MGRVKPREWKMVDIVIAVIGVTMAMYQLISSQYLFTDFVRHMNIHLGFALLLIFLVSFKNSRKIGRWLALGLMALSLISVGYVHIFADALQMRATFNTPLDLVIGVLLILLVLVAAYVSFGPLLVVVAGLAILYVFLGHHLPGFFRTMEINPTRAIANLSIGLSGVYELLTLSANFIFLFVLLGAILQVSGGTEFFIQVGRLAGGRLTSGPAMSAVVTSALAGTIMGSIGANIATTGSFTIPLMKRVGYKPEQAAAIEAAASSGGQIMPPVMGVAAFAMAGITGIPYLKIVVAAIIPAILYFLVVGLYTQFRAMALTNLSRVVEPVDVREMLLRVPLFVVPLGVIVYLLTAGHSLMYCAFWGIIFAIAISLIRKQTRASLSDWIKGFTSGAVAGAQIAAAVALVGMIVRVLIMTGMAVRLPGAVEAWSGGILIIALVIVMIISIILGMGMATLAVYLTVAMVAAPVLLKMGLGLLQAHFFVFFFAIFSAVTPPIAPGAIIASKLAGARYLPTALEAVKASLAGFVLPFLIIWYPELLLQFGSSSVFLAVIRLLSCLVLLVTLEVAIVNHYLMPLKHWERISFVICAAFFIGFFVTKGAALLVAGVILFISLTVLQVVRKRRLQKSAQGAVGRGLA